MSKYLKKDFFLELLSAELERVEDRFDEHFDASGKNWRDQDEDYQYNMLAEAIDALWKAYDLPYGVRDTKNIEERTYRLQQMRKEFTEVAQYALQGADFCTQMIISNKKSALKPKKKIVID